MTADAQELYAELALLLQPLGTQTVLALRIEDECDSTQRLCHLVLDEATADAGGAIVAVVLAGHQTTGQGREGRTWHDVPGNSLLLSVGVVAAIPAATLEGLQERVAEAVVRAITRSHPSAQGRLIVRLPNDLYAADGSRKIGGVIVDATTTGDLAGRVVVGCGVNVAGDPFEVSDGRLATTVEALTGTPADRGAIDTQCALGVLTTLLAL